MLSNQRMGLSTMAMDYIYIYIYIYIPDANHGASIFTYLKLAHKNGVIDVGIHIPAPF